MLHDKYISSLPTPIKVLVAVFLLVLSVGYFTGLLYVDTTTGATPRGVVENYNGNEDVEASDEMKFRKGDREMLSIIHTHVLSMAIIFGILGLLVYGTDLHPKVKSFLMVEPLLSVLITFGGIYLIWSGVEWMSYIVMVSGALMTLSFVGSVVAVWISLAQGKSS